MQAGTDVSKSSGHLTVLTYEEEQKIAATCQAMQELGFGFTRAMVAEVITDYLVSTFRPNPFCGGVLDTDWRTLFSGDGPSSV